MGKNSRTVAWWVLSPPQQGAPPLVTSNVELNSSASHSTFETLVGLVCLPSPDARRRPSLAGLLTMVVCPTKPARISARPWYLSPTNLPGEQHNQTSRYHSWLFDCSTLDLDRLALARSSARLPVSRWIFGDRSMLLEYSPQRKRIRSQLNARCNLHREARYSVFWSEEDVA